MELFSEDEPKIMQIGQTILREFDYKENANIFYKTNENTSGNKNRTTKKSFLQIVQYLLLKINDNWCYLYNIEFSRNYFTM